MSLENVIESLELEELPEERALYRRVYRATSSLGRNYAKDFYYLVSPGEFSLERLKFSNVTFTFFEGAPAEIIQIDSKGQQTRLTLGEEEDEVSIPAGSWYGFRLNDEAEDTQERKWALLKSTYLPGSSWETP